MSAFGQHSYRRPHLDARTFRGRGRAQKGAFLKGFDAGHWSLLEYERPPVNPYRAQLPLDFAGRGAPTWRRGLANEWDAGFRAGEDCAAPDVPPTPKGDAA